MPGLRANGLFRDLGSRAFSSGSLPDSQDAIRAELFSAERLEQYAESVAAQRVLAEGQSGRPLSPRVRDSGRVLLRCYRELAAVIREEGAITPAAEWFVDNFHVVVLVSPEDDAELRRVSVTNLGVQTREIELTSYAELVLAPPAADAAHQAFSSLFVQTEWVADLGALLATRRTRSAAEPSIWAPTPSSSRVSPAAALNTKPTEGGFSVGAAEFARRCRSSTGDPCRTRQARCSTRSSASDGESASRRERAPGLSSRRSSAHRAKPPWRWPTSIATPRRSSARSRWPGRRPTSSSTISGLAWTRPACSRISRRGFSTRIRRYGPRWRC